MEENLIFLVYKTVDALMPDDWITFKLVHQLSKSLKNKPQEIHPVMLDMFRALEAYDEMADKIVDKATTVFEPIFAKIRSDAETVKLVSAHLSTFNDKNKLEQACKIVDEVEAGLKPLIEPIIESMTDFNDKMSLGQLGTILSSIKVITDKYNGEAVSIAEAKQVIGDFTTLLQHETIDTPSRFDNSKYILENCVADFIKPFIDANNTEQSCAEEYYLKSSLNAPFAALIAPEVH